MPNHKGQPFTHTSTRAVRAAFAQFWADRCREVPAYGTDKPARRQAFCVFVDDLERDGQISEALAARVTLADD